MAGSIRIQTQDFDLSTEVARLREGDLRVGAVCAFVGTVRDMQALTRLCVLLSTRSWRLMIMRCMTVMKLLSFRP